MTGHGVGPLVIGCGALVTELRAVLASAGLTEAVEVRYLPANLHNRPERIAPAVDELLSAHADRQALVAYADCGTGGALDRVLDRFPRAERISGAHCYEFFAGPGTFAALHDAEPGTFYLTDFLAKHFGALVWQGLGLDRHPSLRDMYFGNYRRVVLLSQTTDDEIVEAGQAAATALGLTFEHRHVGLEPFADEVTSSLTLRRRAA